jgi:hypothetical protein
MVVFVEREIGVADHVGRTVECFGRMKQIVQVPTVACVGRRKEEGMERRLNGRLFAPPRLALCPHG